LGENSILVEKIEKACALALSRGYQLDQEAFLFIQQRAKDYDPIDLIKHTLGRIDTASEKLIFITRNLLEETLRAKSLEEIPATSFELKEGKGAFRPYAKEVKGNIEVLEDPTETLSSIEDAGNFLSYFRDRFTRIEHILRRRIDARNAVSISEAAKARVNSEVKTIGMVTNKKETKGAVLMRIEDLVSSATIFVPSTANRTLIEKARMTLLDQVICVQATKGRGNILIATDLIWPDTPEKKHKRSYEPVYAALTSDLHVGSNNFLEDAFNRFLRWLHGKVGNNRQTEIAGRVKYLVIAGDVADGIGVYPNQEEELAITDVVEQYGLAARLLEEVPDYIEVIIIPGNHDATRQALPQPAILKKYAESLYAARKITALGNPARVRLHGVEFLLYHGRSLDDVIGSVPNIMYQNLGETVQKALELLLRARHLAPSYGGKTPIAPEPKDHLVIDVPPDIFQVGHVHVVGYEEYRGTLLVNSGSWQRQTNYQERMGLTPKPGIVPVVDLQSFNIMPIDFKTTVD